MDERSARAAERQRIAAILNAPEAAGREASAKHLALNTEFSVAEARATLGTSSARGESPIIAAAKRRATAAAAGKPLRD